MTRVMDLDGALLTTSTLQPRPASGSANRSLLSEPLSQFPLRLCEGEVWIRLKGPGPDWLYPTLSAMQHLDRLEPDWDSYGAPRVDSEAILRALQTLSVLLDNVDGPPPIVVPTSAGDVQLEWHQGGVDLEIRCSRAGAFSIYFFDHGTGREEEVGNIDSDVLDRFAAILRRI